MDTTIKNTTLKTLRKAEDTLHKIEISHPRMCGCVICRAALAVWNARYSIEHPGWETRFRE